jgi:ferric iron reductase protein FhuF
VRGAADGSTGRLPGGDPPPRNGQVVEGDAAAALVGRAIARFPPEIAYVRVEVGPDPSHVVAPGTVPSEDGWLPCGGLLGDPDWLATVIEHTGRSLGAGERVVAASLFAQNYAYRVLMAAVACMTTSGVVPDCRAEAMAITVARGRPYVVGYDAPTVLVGCGAVGGGEGEPVEVRRRFAGTDLALDYLLHGAIDAHLALLVDTTRARFRIGERLLWGNIAASAAVAFRTMDGCLGPWMRPVGERFFERAPGEMQALGSFLALEQDGRRGWFWERTNCCLYDRLPGKIRCADCSRTPPAERRVAYLRSLSA